MKSETQKWIGLFGVVGVLALLLRNSPRPTRACRNVAPEERLEALAQLIRPDEVSWVPAWLGGILAAEKVGSWMRRTFKYKPDKPGPDQWCPPAVTLKRGGGDCDDLAIMGCSVLRAAGIESDVRTGTMDQGEGPVGHAWVEGYDWRGWFLLEATSGAVHRCLPAGYVAMA